MPKNVRFAEVKLKDIESGVPFEVYHCRVGKDYDIFTEKMGVFEGVPMKIQLTINYTKTSYQSDEEAKMETNFLIRDFYAIFSIGEEEIEMRWDDDSLSVAQAQNKILRNSIYGISGGQSMLSAKHLLPPQRRNDPLKFDGELTMNNIMYSFWKIATLMHLSLIGDCSWLYHISNPAGIFAVIHSAFTISPIAMKCYMSIVKSNERMAINQLTQVIEYCQTNDSFNNRPIEAVVAPIVSAIHECGKPELFRSIPMEVRTILVPHFNKENQHEIVAELNHYTDGRYHDLNDMSRWEL
jgi:hypothetical protein